MYLENIFETREAARTENFAVRPAANIFESPKEIVLEVELPGISKDAISVEIEGDELTVTAKRPASETKEGYETVYFERNPYGYSRSFLLNADIQREKVSARHVDGVLTLTLLKNEKPAPKKITVE